MKRPQRDKKLHELSWDELVEYAVQLERAYDDLQKEAEQPQSVRQALEQVQEQN